jgi:MYXO-CTERM domain-containing protein
MRRTHQHTALALLAAAAVFATPRSAEAVQDAGLFEGLELASGLSARSQRVTTTQVPMRAQAAWSAFQHDVGGRWVVSWDEATKVPARIFGSGIEAPGSVAKPGVAEQTSRQMLQRHLALLAPGAELNDFVLAANVLHRGMRVVSFLQQHDGLPVLGGQLSFRFKNDRLFVIASDAKPFVASQVGSVTVEITEAQALASAKAWIAKDFATTPELGDVSGPLLLPIVSRGTQLAVVPVMKVVVDVANPRARFDVFVDVRDGSVVAREQTLHFANGQLLYNTPVRYPLSTRGDFPAAFTQIQVDGQNATADAQGTVSFPGANAQVTTSLDGTFATIQNQNGQVISTTLPLSDAGSAIWEASIDPDDDAQLTAFIHTGIIKDYARNIAPEMSWIDAKLPVKVNHNDQCNAFYDGQSINFFRQSANCENTGRLADVVYHEFGHGFHHHAVILGSGDFESALSEGVSDYLAATFTGDPGMGRGFFKSSAPLRHIDPTNPKVWPDDITGDPHATGLIIAGALWDLRELLVIKYGETEGVSVANALFYGAMRNASDIPTMYPEILAVDDDDGNLDNGTPNACEIAQAFTTHGLRTLAAAPSDLSAEPPTQDGHAVSIEVLGLFPQCGNESVEKATVIHRLEDEPAAMATTVDMSGGPSIFTGMIPPQPTGETVRYRVEVELAGGITLGFPDNDADPNYQFFVGNVTPIYCTDFETDPVADGWTHQLLSGEETEGADDWQWDTPNGNSTNGDPSTAFSGDFVFGNDLGHDNFNGLYQGDKVNVADSPVIDVSGYDNVRLQYRRWLSVEDGFFDKATIYANGQSVWTNFASPSQDANTHHTDREWRFHDVDLTDSVSEDGTVQVRFEIASDQGLHLGGWTLDDFCVVTYDGSTDIDPVCGNGTVEIGEECDDGNTLSLDGCSATCSNEASGTDPGVDDPEDPTTSDGLKIADSGCGCRVTGVPQRNELPLALLALGLSGLALRRRRQ